MYAKQQFEDIQSGLYTMFLIHDVMYGMKTKIHIHLGLAFYTLLVLLFFFFNYITERKSERSHLTHPGGNQHPLQEGSLELPHRVALQLGVELHLLGSRRLQGGNLGPLQEGSLEPLPLAARRV